MGFPFRFVLIAGFALGLSILAPTVSTADPAIWPQDVSDLPADPAVLYGTLPNGMRYALMHNATPANQASIRFRVGSGSLEESDQQQGLAHFLEHMAFKGSTHVPAGEMVKLLQRKGLAFGADTNAFTEWSQTVYELDLPEADDDLVDTGLMLMRETASELTLDAAAMEPERGVVLSEERVRDTPSYRSFVARLSLLLDGQLASNRLPIGQVEVIQKAPIDLIRDYYRANYRPDRATLIMVGDFDPKAIETKIKQRFADWQPTGPGVTEPDLGQVAKRGLTAKVVEVKGASTQLQINWAHPYDNAPDTTAKRARTMIESIGIGILNERLSKLLRGEQPPFLTASASAQNLFKSARIASVIASAKPDAWRPALAALDREQRRIVDYGVTQAELDRILTVLRAGLQQQVDGAATRLTPALAGGLLGTISNDQVFVTPLENQALLAELTKTLTVTDVNEALRQLFAGAGPLIQLSAAQPIEGGDDALMAEYAKDHAVALAASAADVVPVWPYTSFGKPGTVVGRHDLAEAGAVAVRFANGVRLTVKPTKFRTDEVLVRATVGGGRLDFPKDHAIVGWALGSFVEGGLDAISRDDLDRALASKIFGVTFGVQDQAFVLNGSTRPQDLDTQLQVLTAYVAHPGFRPEALERQRTWLISNAAQREATPGGVLGRDLSGLLHGGDARWGFPNPDQLAAARPDLVKSVLQRPLAGGPIEVTIVGDITVDQAIQQVATTFGALPPRPFPKRPPSASNVHFPARTAKTVTLTHKGRPDQAIAFIAWPLPDFYADLAQSYAMDLLDDILQFRLLEAVRIAEGATYSPQGTAIQSPVFSGFGYAESLVETPPDKIASFYAHVSAITASMAADGVTEDQLARARNPRIESAKKEQLTNGYWLDALTGVQADPRKLQLIRLATAGYAQATAADIQRAAKAYFRDDRAWKLTVLPAAGAAN